MMEVQSRLRGGQSLDSLAEEFSLKTAFHPADPLVILNYNQCLSAKRHPVVRECRGLTLDTRDWSVAARSFPRFFNAGEAPDLEAGFDWRDFSAESKEDGSLILLYWYGGSWRVNTRGSFGLGEICPGGPAWRDAFLATLGVEPGSADSGLRRDHTYAFEFCSPWNKVVRRYPEPTAFLLSAFENGGGREMAADRLDVTAAYLRCRRPERLRFAGLDDVRGYIRRREDPTFEGLVLRDGNGLRLKVKSERYVALHQLGANGNIGSARYLLPVVMAGEEGEVLTYYPEYREECLRVKAVYEGAVEELERLWEENSPLPSQKDFALAVKGHPLAFALFERRKRGGELRDHLTALPEKVQRALGL